MAGTTSNVTGWPLTTPAQNPAWPALSILAWPDNPPASGALPTSGAAAAVPLNDRTKKMTITRGRQYELDQDQTADVQLTVDNLDGALTGGANGMKPMRPCQITATWAGTTYPLFTGYVERWPTQATDPAHGWSTVQGVDLLSPLTTRTVRSGMTESVLAQAPTLYWPLTDVAGSGSAAQLAPVAAGVTKSGMTFWCNGVTANPTTGLTPGGFGQSSPISADGTTAFKSTNSGTTLGLEGLQVQLNASGAPTFDATKPWAVAFTASPDSLTSSSQSGTPNNDCVLFYLYDLNNNPLGGVWFYVGPTGTTIQMELLPFAGSASNSSNPLVVIETTTPIAQSSGPIAVMLGYDGSNYFLTTNYVTGFLWQANTQAANNQAAPSSGTSSSCTVPQPFVMPPIGDFTVGMAYTPQGVLVPSQPVAVTNVTVAHVAVWNGSAASGWLTLSTSYFNAVAGFIGETSDQRVGRILGWLGITNTGLDTGITKLGAQAITPQQPMMDVLRQVQQDDVARFFISAAGTALLYTRNHAQYGPLITPQVTLGGNESVGEVPYTAPPLFDYDPQHVANDVQVTRTGGPMQRATDATSQAEYFQRLLQVQMNLQTDTDATLAAQWLLSRYKEPALRIESVTIDIGSNPNRIGPILGLDLGAFVQVNHRSVTAPTVSVLTQVEQITHDVAPDHWTVTLALSPVIASYGNVGGSVLTLPSAIAAGTQVLTFNPLSDSASNPAEDVVSYGPGHYYLLGFGTAHQEPVQVFQVHSQPTPNATGYTSFQVVLNQGCTYAHAAGELMVEAATGASNDARTYSPRAQLGTTTILGW